MSTSPTQFLYSPPSHHPQLSSTSEQPSNHTYGTHHDAFNGTDSLHLLADHAIADQPVHQARNRSVSMNSTSSTLDNESAAAMQRSKKKGGVGRGARGRYCCTTCRQRHLKCDKMHPICTNCTKSKRECCWNHEIRLSHDATSSSFSSAKLQDRMSTPPTPPTNFPFSSREEEIPGRTKMEYGCRDPRPRRKTRIGRLPRKYPSHKRKTSTHGTPQK